MISGSTDFTLKMWDVETGKLIKSLEGHKGAVIEADCRYLTVCRLIGCVYPGIVL